MLVSASLVKNAIERAEHLAQAVSWYADVLKNDAGFQSRFCSLVEELSSCARSEHSSRQAIFLAVGKSAQVASLAVSMLVSVGILARFVHPTEAFHGDFGVFGQQDLVVLLSNNGNSAELLQLLQGLRERRCLLYALTAKPHSPLAQSVDQFLPIPPFAEGCPLVQAPITSSVTMLALCQLLVAATVEKRDYPLTEYAHNHPGGAIGRRIFLKVSDLMIQGDNLPWVEPEDSFQTVISRFTHFSKAAVLVLDKEKKCLGLVAERDLRLAMEQHGADVFCRKALDFMNTHPITIQPNVLAVRALEVMRSKSPPLNLLPVIDGSGTAVGLVRMLDVLAAGVVL